MIDESAIKKKIGEIIGRERHCLNVWDELKAIDANMNLLVYGGKKSNKQSLVDWVTWNAQGNDFQDAMMIAHEKIIKSKDYRVCAADAADWSLAYGTEGLRMALKKFAPKWEKLESRALELIKTKLNKK